MSSALWVSKTGLAAQDTAMAAVANNLAGTGFNDGNLVMRGTLTNLINLQPVARDGNVNNLDLFGGDNYPNNDTIGLSGNVAIEGNITFANPAYFSLAPGESFTTFFLTTQ